MLTFRPISGKRNKKSSSSKSQYDIAVCLRSRGLRLPHEVCGRCGDPNPWWCNPDNLRAKSIDDVAAVEIIGPKFRAPSC